MRLCSRPISLLALSCWSPGSPASFGLMSALASSASSKSRMRPTGYQSCGESPQGTNGAGANAGAVPPLRQADDGVGPARTGQEQMLERRGHVALEMVSVVGKQQAQQEVAQAGVV